MLHSFSTCRIQRHCTHSIHGNGREQILKKDNVYNFLCLILNLDGDEQTRANNDDVVRLWGNYVRKMVMPYDPPFKGFTTIKHANLSLFSLTLKDYIFTNHILQKHKLK